MRQGRHRHQIAGADRRPSRHRRNQVPVQDIDKIVRDFETRPCFAAQQCVEPRNNDRPHFMGIEHRPPSLRPAAHRSIGKIRRRLIAQDLIRPEPKPGIEAVSGNALSDIPLDDRPPPPHRFAARRVKRN